MSLILFDLVATLIDSGPRYVEAYLRTSHNFGQHHLPTREDLTEMLGEKNLKQIVAACSPQIKDQDMSRFMSACNTMCDRLLTESDWTETLYPDTETTLKALKAQSHELGIYTGTREDAMLAQIYHHGLIHYFTPYYIEGKNNLRDGMLDSVSLKTMQLRKIMANYMNGGFSKADIHVVGDSPADAMAAKALGLNFIGIARSLKTHEKLKSFEVETIVASLFEIPEMPIFNRHLNHALPEARSAPSRNS